MQAKSLIQMLLPKYIMIKSTYIDSHKRTLKGNGSDLRTFISDLGLPGSTYTFNRTMVINEISSSEASWEWKAILHIIYPKFYIPEP